MEILGIVLFIILLISILKGYPVCFTLGGVSVLFVFIISIIYPQDFSISIFNILPSRFMGIINNYLLISVPLFIFMGIMLQKSGLAESLLETMTIFFGGLRGGLAISVIIVGTLLAASTGIIGATVVTMTLISLPIMLNKGYSTELSTGIIISSGALGQIMPPSIVLILLADQINASSAGDSSVNVGTLFTAALIPALLLVGFYIVYIILLSLINKKSIPTVSKKDIQNFRDKKIIFKVIKILFLPLSLIILVLGSIFTGIASPTEASGIGALGAIGLSILQKKFNLHILKETMRETVKLTTMIFFILLGATTFTLVFRSLDGDLFLQNMITHSSLTPTAFILILMIIIFICGFFIDFIEIIFIFVPVVTPILNMMEVPMLWVGILIALNLQTSFLSPPFGFAIFYLKGVAPKEVRTIQIYRGVIPFIIIQLIVLITVIAFPEIVMVL